VIERPLLTCREILDFLSAYLGGELAESARAEFDRHLRVCPACVAYVDGYRATIGLVEREAHHAGDAATAEAVPEALVRAILAARLRGAQTSKE
jgi:anti-sigma factor RsiW